MKKKIGKIIKQIDNYEYVSFDMFDTLIKRNVRNPKDVFKLMELKLNQEFEKIFEDFKKKRIIAEQEARKITSEEEITLEEIYNQLNKYYNAEIISYLINLEKQIELEICVSNKYIVDIYKYCVNKGKKILIISDMYLPKDLLEEILNLNGFIDYDKLYVSSDTKFQKMSGSLFKYVLKDLSIKNKEIVHIGDGKKNDFIRPKMLGIKSILIPEQINYSSYYSVENISESDIFSYQTITTYINNNIDLNKSIYWKIGYETLGPLLYGFSQWLYTELKKKDIKKVFFFARDGQIMKAAFDLINKTDIKSEYFYASRRALIVPSIWRRPELEEILSTMFIPKKISIKTFFKKLGINPQKYEKEIKQQGFELDSILNTNLLLENKQFIDLYEILKCEIVGNSKKEYEVLLKYLEKMNFTGEVAIVDIGWHGNMQRSLRKIVETEANNVKVHGFYTGILSKNNNDTSNMQGYLFDKDFNVDLFQRENCFNSLFETFFLAQHGSVEKYSIVGEDVLPVLYKYEYSTSENQYSKEAQIVKQIQEGAISFVKDFSKQNFFEPILISPHCAFQNIQQLGVSPKMSDVEIFGDFRFYDTDIKYLAKPRKIYKYIFKPKELYTDFFNTAWRIGFLKRLFKIPLPYFGGYMLMRKYLIKKE